MMGMLLAPLRAIVDLSCYREAPRRSGAWIAGYLAYLGLLFAVAGTFAVKLRWTPLLDETIDWAARSVPPLTFQDGKLTSTTKGQVRLQHPRLKDFAVLIDTTRTAPVTPDDLERENAVVFLTQDALYVKVRAGRVEQQDLALFRAKEAVVVDGELIRGFGRSLRALLYPLAFCFLGLFFVVRKIVAAAGYALVAMLLNGALDFGLPPGDLWKIAAVAQAPAAALEAVQLFLPKPVPLFGLITFTVVTVYLWQALAQNRRVRTDTPGLHER